jgi:hypothetical protein
MVLKKLRYGIFYVPTDSNDSGLKNKSILSQYYMQNFIQSVAFSDPASYIYLIYKSKGSQGAHNIENNQFP